MQCDSYDNDPNDGIATFNLEQANPKIVLEPDDPVHILYYNSESDAILDQSNSKTINPIYRNKNQNEIIYAKVIKLNTDCYNIATIRLKTTQQITLSDYVLQTCDPENKSKAIFDLAKEKQTITNDLNLSEEVNISFYKNETDAAIGKNTLPDLYESGNKDIYIRAESDNRCYGTGILSLQVRGFPKINNKELYVCPNEFPLNINTGLDRNIISNYNYTWNTGENTEEISVTQAGNYSVEITDSNLGCSKTIHIEIHENPLPSITNLNINNTTIKIETDDSSNYE